MPDREKVIKGLETFNKNRICLPHLIPWDDITDAIVLLKEQEPCWILCSDRLPKSNPEDLEYPVVIIALKDGTVELGCYYESTKEWGAGENFNRPRQPVAWMPLPELCANRS